MLLSPWTNDLGLRIFKKFALCLSVEGVKVVIRVLSGYLSKLLRPSRNKRTRVLLTFIIKQCCDNLESDFNVLCIKTR